MAKKAFKKHKSMWKNAQAEKNAAAKAKDGHERQQNEYEEGSNLADGDASWPKIMITVDASPAKEAPTTKVKHREDTSPE